MRAIGPISLLGAALIEAQACGRGGQSVADGAADLVPVDAPAIPEAASAPLALDFSASGCGTFDANLPRCNGTAPLSLTFTPIASAEVTRFLWTFGDDTPDSSDRSAVHTYALPGPYRVTLVGLVPGLGSLQQTHDKYVNVVEAHAGGWCDVDMQCEDGLVCWCGSAAPCTPVLARGLCSRSCDPSTGAGASCPSGTACADLSVQISPASPPPMTPTTNTSWRRPVCLPSCVDDSSCTGGLGCRDLPNGDPITGWTRACFAGYPLPIGSPCRDATGKLVDADCAGRLCADLGAHGRCSADCSGMVCPNGAGCAQLGDGRYLCLSRCAGAESGLDGGSSDTACDDDPLLACELPGSPGPLGFTVPGASPTTKYCAPKRCARASDCAPAGTCPSGGGNCQSLTGASPPT